jgi:hypothetical protein
MRREEKHRVKGKHKTGDVMCWSIARLVTACLEGFFEAEKGMENVIKSTKFISKICALKRVIRLKLFLLCHSLFLEKFEFNYTF